LINKIKKHICTEKFSKFVLIGVWNTIFGISAFFILYHLFNQYCNYMILVIIANILSITNAYILYKLFVFKTRGNYLREYLRFYVVYGLVFSVSILLFPVFMEFVFPFLQKHLPNYYNVFQYKAYLSQLCIVSITMFISYFGHDKFSFNDKVKNNILQQN
jgi:putative flippase GtrA